jgi:hypothetical protein
MLQEQKPSKNYRYGSREREGLDCWMEAGCCEKQKNESYLSRRTEVKYSNNFSLTRSFFFLSGVMNPFLAFLPAAWGPGGHNLKSIFHYFYLLKGSWHEI